MQEVMKFNNNDFGEVEALLIDGEMWFIAKEIALLLGYSNARDAIATHVEGEDKGVAKRDTLGGKQDVTIINEAGLYSLILSSRMAAARRFKCWITREVIPSIRKNGGYIAGQEVLSNEEILAKAVIVANSVQDYSKNKQIEQMQEKASYYDELIDKRLCTNFRDTAKELGIKEKQFISYLLDKRMIYRNQSGKLLPYARYDKLFTIKEYSSANSNHAGIQTFITPQGRSMLLKRLQEEGIKGEI